MYTWLEILIAGFAVASIGYVLWKVAAALKGEGVVVRPVSMMDAQMTKIEERHRHSKEAQSTDAGPSD